MLHKKVAKLDLILPELDKIYDIKLNEIYDELISFGKSALLVCGIDNVHAQLLTNSINDLIFSEAKTQLKSL